jgi:O-antigen/teichoic acid export membrane protein
MSSTTPDVEQTTKGFAAQFPRNLIANIAYFLVNVVTGVLLVPYFIDTLGLAAYGLIPLATTITGYVAIIVQSLNTAVTRFLTVDLQRGDYAAANRTFNTALVSFSTVIFLMIPVVVMFAYFVPSIFQIPAGQEDGAILLFLGVSASLLIRSWSGNFTVQLFAYNRLDLQNLVNLTNLLVQTGLIILLFTLLGPDLGLIGEAYLAGAVAASGVSIVLAHRICPYLHVSIHSFDRRRVKDLCGMGWWGMIEQIGHLFLFQIDLIVVNMLFGAVLAGEYAIALQWRILLQAIAVTLTGVLIPTILAYYASKQTEALIKITLSAVKFMGLAMALPIGLICGFAPQLLTIWVGAEHAGLALLMVILTAHLAVNISVQPLFSVNVAYNRVRIPGVVTIVLGTANLILAIAIPLLTGWGYYGVAIGGILILTLRHTFFIPWYVSRVLDTRMTTYLKALVPGALAAVLIGGMAASVTIMIPSYSFITLMFAGIAIMLIYGVNILAFGLNPFERQLFRSCLPQGWKRYVEQFILVISHR